MNQIEVNKDELLQKLKANRDNHRSVFLKAQEGYRKKVIEELEKMLQEARDGSPIRRAIQMPQPEDRTEDYDMLILMLTMDTAKTVTLTPHDFAQYVQDKWDWSAMVTACNTRYIAGE